MGVEIHRDVNLDQFIGLDVRINFLDDSWCEGILVYSGWRYGVMGYKLLTKRNGLLRFTEIEGIYTFTKTNVRCISLNL